MVQPNDDVDMQSLARTLRLLNRYIDGALADSHGDAEGHAPLPVQRVRGPRQQAILAIPGMADAEGMTPAAIAAQISYSASNTYNLLQSLGRSGLTEVVPGSHPQRWRLTTEHRHSATVFCQLAGAVRAGEWTTCGDISIASRGDTSASWLVCWAATRLPDFPGPHRVLLECGIAHPDGHDHRRPGPEQIRAALTDEGVGFTSRGRADPAVRVPWDELRERVRP